MPYIKNEQLLFLLLFTFGHLLYINTPFVNFEWVYRLGSDYFYSKNPLILAAYFENQANPISYSFISSLLVKISNIDDYFVYRLPSLFGSIILLYALAKFNNIWLLLVVGLNPLIWIYSGRAYSEMLSVGLMVFALHSANIYIRGFLSLFSAIVKYHSLPLILTYSLFAFIFDFLRQKITWFNQHVYFVVGLIGGFSFFIFLYFKSFGIWMVPEKFASAHFKITFLSVTNNLFSYCFYLSGMFFLTIPAFLNTEKFKLKAILLVFSILFGLTNQNLGEMDFGSFQQLLGNEIILLIKIIGFWNFLLCCQAFWKDEDSRILLLTILGYILLLSLTRPANRYLIFVVPFWAILVCQHISLSRMFWWGYVSVLAGLNLFATLYQVSNATASSNMAYWAIQNDVKITGGILRSHVGDFSHYDPNSPLAVSLAGAQVGRILHEEPVNVLGFPIRSYVLTDTKSN